MLAQFLCDASEFCLNVDSETIKKELGKHKPKLLDHDFVE